MHVGIANPRWQGKPSRHSRRIHNPQFCVSGQRPMVVSPSFEYFKGTLELMLNHVSKRGYWTQLYSECSMACWGSLSMNNLFNTLKPRQNGQHFPDDIFKCIFLTENVWFSFAIWYIRTCTLTTRHVITVYYSDVIGKTWHLKASTNIVFIQQPVPVNDRGNINPPYDCPFVMRIHPPQRVSNAKQRVHAITS